MSSKTRRQSPKGKQPTPRQRLLNRLGLVLVVAFVAFALYVKFTTPRKAGNSRPLPQRQGEAWEYDERFDAYWDPRQGHEHWHEGRPPAPDER